MSPIRARKNASLQRRRKKLREPYEIDGYEKGSDVFRLTYPLVDQAIDRAAVRDRICEENGTDNPSTKMYQLVTYLQSLKKL
jgi:hypothetical protein